ncbi:SDR family NAD(P)-dependent oxidoreductase [Planctomycetota bacterium]
MQNETIDLGRLFDLKGQVAIVTGSARGIGRAIAEGLAQAGVSVVLADILEDELKQTAKTIKGRNLTAIAIPTDLCKPEDLANLVEQTIKRFGRIDILVNCAGVSIGAACQDYPEDAWNITFDVNVFAAFRLSKLAAKYMIEQQSGRIINLTSIGAVLGFPNNPAYQASKGALLQLTRAMACDWAKYNIRVNNIIPGYFKAPMTEKSWSNPETKKQRAAMCLLNRWGNPGELVGPVIFLASSASSYITGNDLFVDGGFVKTGMVAGS